MDVILLDRMQALGVAVMEKLDVKVSSRASQSKLDETYTMAKNANNNILRGAVKSVQRGTASTTKSGSTGTGTGINEVTVTIGGVVPGKCVVSVSGINYLKTSSSGSVMYVSYGYLTDATHLKIGGGYSLSGGAGVDVHWQVVEYY